jgi:hypothetical protein
LVVVALLAGLFGCCCVCYDVDVVLAAGKKDAYGLNANSGDVNFYAAVVADVGAVVVAEGDYFYKQQQKVLQFKELCLFLESYNTTI